MLSLFFFSKIMVWFCCSALSSPVVCSFPLHGSSTAQGQRGSCFAAFPAAPGCSHCPGNAGTGQTQLPNPQAPGHILILLSWRWFERAAKYLLLLPTLSPTPSICSSHFIFHLSQTFKCSWPSCTWMKPRAAEEFGMQWGKDSSMHPSLCTELGDGAKSEGLFRALQLWLN